MSTQFLPEYMHNGEQLERYLQTCAVEAIAQIEAYEPAAVLDYRWQIAWLVVTAPFRLILELFLECLQPLLECAGATHLAIHCKILHSYLIGEDNFLVALWRNGENVLAPLFNEYALSSSDVFLSPPVEISTIQDKQVIDILSVRSKTTVNFYSAAGVCHGIGTWFCYLYLLTEDQFRDDPDKHLRAITSLFYYGAPAPAALIQALFHEESLINWDSNHVGAIPLVNGKDEIYRAVTKFDPGVYSLVLPIRISTLLVLSHQINYIKINDHLGYIIEPNGGVIKINNEDPAKAVTDYLWEYRSNATELEKSSQFNTLYIFYNRLKSPAKEND